MKRARFSSSAALSNLISSAAAVLIGLLFGLVVLLLCDSSQAFPAIRTLISGGFGLAGFPKTMARICYYAVPMIVCGLSVSFAFKTGTLNLGASGQYTAGAFAAVCAATYLHPFLGSSTWIVGVAAGALAGGLIALIPGVLNAFRNVNIIIGCIMMNYIATYGVSLLLKNSKALYDATNSQNVAIPKEAVLPKWGLDALFPSSGAGANAGIIIAIFMGVLIYFVIRKTTFGFELKLCGYNRHAARYAGVNEKRSIILAMAISGALSGLAGALVHLSSTTNHIFVTDTISGVGFTGIAVALLGMTNPLGVIVSGALVAYLQVGGVNLQIYGFSSELIDIILAVIIYSCAFSQMIGGRVRALFLHSDGAHSSKSSGEKEERALDARGAEGSRK